ncbi:MAG TPA: GAP family protein, partial [Actinomycetes bacterium]|nr:GAP family protein [Actinomycetes bacterium]
TERNVVTSEVLPLAIAIAVSPFPVIPVILLLFNPGAPKAALAFLTGWVIGVGLATTVFVFLGDFIDQAKSTPTWASWLQTAVGVTLVVLGARQWLARGTSAQVPGWMASLADAAPSAALRLGLLLSAANPKVLLLAAASGLTIADVKGSVSSEIVAVGLFTLVASISVATPVALFVAFGEATLVPLGRAKDWLQRNNAIVMAVVITVIGIILLVKGLSGV